MTPSDTNVIQPNLVCIPGERSGIIKEKCIDGTPYLVVEVLRVCIAAVWELARGLLRPLLVSLAFGRSLGKRRAAWSRPRLAAGASRFYRPV
jgi:hypothetical protein